jgi:flagellar assembly factor FliW
VKIATTRFGEIDIRESEMITIKGSILGFGRLRRFVLLIHDDQTPLWWMQSVDDPAIAFVVINPRIVKPDYTPALQKEDLDFLDIRNEEDIALLSIVTVRPQPLRITANIRAPLLINATSRTGNQIVLENTDYPIQYDVLGNRANVETWLSSTCAHTDKLSAITAGM